MQRFSMMLVGIGVMALIVALEIREVPDSAPLAPEVPDPPAAPRETPATDPGAGRFVAPLTAIAGHWLVEQALADDPGLPVEEDRVRYGTLKGRLVWRDQRVPLRDVEVAMTRSWLDTVLPTIVEDEPQNPVLLERRVRTDELGRFAIHPVPTDGNLFFLIGRDQPFMDFRKVPTLPFPGQTVDLGDIYIEERGELVGKVVGERSSGFGDVTVRAVDDPFQKDPLAAEERRRQRNLEVLDPEGMAAGEIVPAWLARRDELLPFPETLARPDGGFSLRGLRPGQHRVFFRSGSGATERSVLIVAGQTTDLGEVELDRRATLMGRLVMTERDAPQTPAALPFSSPVRSVAVVGAEVAVVSTDWGIGPPVQRTNARGEFGFSGLAADRSVNLLYRTSAGAPWQFLDTLVPARRLGRTYVIPKPRRALFRVVDLAGQRIDEVRLTLLRTTDVFRPQDVRLPATLQPRPLRSGDWAASLGNWGGVRVIASKDGYAPAAASVGPEAFEPAGMRLTMLASFPTRFVVSDHRGDPVESAEVAAAIRSAEWYEFTGSEWHKLSVEPTPLGITGPDGILVRDGFWSTPMVFAASHPRFASSPIRERVPAEGQTVHLRLQQPSRIEGFVTESRRPPVRRWRIIAEPDFPEDHDLFGNPFLRRVTTITSPDGAFSLPRLHPGTWILRPALPAAPGSGGWSAQEEWLQRMSHWVYARQGQVVYADLELEEPPWLEAALAGDVRLDGHSVPGLVVRLVQTQPDPDTRSRRRARRTAAEPGRKPTELHSTLTDHAGRFRFFDTPPGEYLLAIEIPHQGRAQRLTGAVIDSRPEAGESLPVQLDIDIRTGSLQCTVVGLDGLVLAGRMIRIRATEDGSGGEFVILSDALGMIRLPQIASGDYQLSLIDDSGRTVQDPGFHIEAGQFTMRDFLAVEADRK